MKHLHRFVRRAAAFVLAAALALTGCSAGSFLHFGKGSGGSTVQKIDRPAVESAELQFAHHYRRRGHDPDPCRGGKLPCMALWHQ